MQVTNKSIRDVLSRVQSSEIILPALQREFVWKKRDIEGLFDSLLQEYPINTFMSWEVNDILQQSMEFYCFLNPKYKEGDTNSDYVNNTQAHKSVIIDGQQRLTSLYIALYGSYTTAKRNTEMFLYLNMDGARNGVVSVNDDEESGLQSSVDQEFRYNFKFMADADANARICKGEHWLKVRDAFMQNFNPFKWLFDNNLSENEFATTTMHQLMKVFADSAVLNFYEIKRNKLQDVLDVFIRTNNGGKRLTKGDLLLSMITVNWVQSTSKENARRYVEDVVSAVSQEGYRVDKDWVLKCTLFLLAPDVKMDVSNFDRNVSCEIFANKDRIKESIASAFYLIKSFGIQEKGLTSKLAVLPIVHYIYTNKLAQSIRKQYNNGVKKSVATGHYLQMRTWLFRAIVREFFTNGSDAKLKMVRTILINNQRKDYFSTNEIVSQFMNDNANLNVDDKVINTLLMTCKKDSFPVLNIIYSDRIDTSKNYDVDHMHPQKDSNSKVGYDTLPNLQLLDSNQNRSKNDLSLKEWYAQLGQTEKDSLIIPDGNVSMELADFDEFFKAREGLLRKKLEEMLDKKNDRNKVQL